jgi:hypothetical protein
VWFLSGKCFWLFMVFCSQNKGPGLSRYTNKYFHLYRGGQHTVFRKEKDMQVMIITIALLVTIVIIIVIIL